MTANKQRLDHALVTRGIVTTRSQAESWIRLGKVEVKGIIVRKPGHMVTAPDGIRLLSAERYVSRAGLKLASVVNKLSIQFQGSIVLDVGSSTGGFTDYALQHGASRVFAVDVGTEQLHPSLRSDERIELHEKTDIRDFTPSVTPTIVVMDVSFISLREILPHIATIIDKDTQVIAMVKPQFEAGNDQVNRGVIKNDRVRRDILAGFEQWVKQRYVIIDKADSDVAGAKGNRERFYVLRCLAK